MQISEAMTTEIATCSTEDTVQKAAQLMRDNDAGIIPVVEDENGAKKPVGVITDRDIACRVVAEGDSPLEVTVGDVMTDRPVTIHYGATQNAAVRMMERHRVRRLIVTSDAGDCMGIFSLTDLAMGAVNKDIGGVVKKLSEPKRSTDISGQQGPERQAPGQ